jgi:hypothetical protein
LAVNLSPQPRLQWVDANGNPYSGAKLFTYLTGTTTKSTVYKDSGQSVAHANPIVLDSSGRPPAEIWLVEGITYTFVLAPSTDTDPPVSPILTDNDIEGINDASSTLNNEWIAGTTTTYISASSFSVTGDKTSTYPAGRRLKCALSGSTVYATIVSSVYGAVTTVTILVDDAGSIDNTLGTVSYGILYPSNTSIPMLLVDQRLDGLINGYVDWTVSANALTLTLKTASGATPSASNPVYVRFRNTTATSGSRVLRTITSAVTMTVSNGSKLGTMDIAHRLWALLIDTGAGVVIGVYNAVDKANISAVYSNSVSTIKLLQPEGIISTTAEGGAGAADSAGVVYTTAAQTSKPYVLAGFCEIEEAVAGVWATAPTVQSSQLSVTQAMGANAGYSVVYENAVATGTTVIPLDDTSPLVTEGDQYMSITYTPRNAANTLKISFGLMLTATVAGTLVASVYLNGGGAAFYTAGQSITSSGQIRFMDGAFMINAGGGLTSMTIRAGAQAGTTTFNGVAGGRLFGTDNKSFIHIEEIFT